MRFTPKTEKQIEEENLLPKGVYDFEIAGGTDEVSKKGNEMIKLGVRVFNEQGVPFWVTDYLMEQIPHKLRHAAAACGLLSRYEQGVLEGSDFEGKTGRCNVIIQEDKTGQFPAKNVITDYVKPDAKAPVSTPAPREKMPVSIDDEIPFAPEWR